MAMAGEEPQKIDLEEVDERETLALGYLTAMEITGQERGAKTIRAELDRLKDIIHAQTSVQKYEEKRELELHDKTYRLNAIYQLIKNYRGLNTHLLTEIRSLVSSQPVTQNEPQTHSRSD